MPGMPVLIGILYRIPMVAIIGDAGMGVYSTAFSIYNILLLISSYSLPMAVSKLVSAKLSLKQYRNVRQFFLLSFLFGAAMGLAAALIMVFGADFLAGTVMAMPKGVPHLPLTYTQVDSPSVFITLSIHDGQTVYR